MDVFGIIPFLLGQHRHRIFFAGNEHVSSISALQQVWFKIKAMTKAVYSAKIMPIQADMI